jgi:hypothetical protein
MRRTSTDTGLTRAYPLPGGAIEHLGEWLVRRGVLTRPDLFRALDATYRHDCCLGDALVWLGLMQRPLLEHEANRFHRFRGDGK